MGLGVVAEVGNVVVLCSLWVGVIVVFGRFSVVSEAIEERV